jgi:hypothetical protein
MGMSRDDFEKKFVGRTGKIICDHPHSGEIAECIGVDETYVGLGVAFKNHETGMTFYVFTGKDVEWL